MRHCFELTKRETKNRGHCPNHNLNILHCNVNIFEWWHIITTILNILLTYITTVLNILLTYYYHGFEHSVDILLPRFWTFCWHITTVLNILLTYYYHGFEYSVDILLPRFWTFFWHIITTVLNILLTYYYHGFEHSVDILLPRFWTFCWHIITTVLNILLTFPVHTLEWIFFFLSKTCVCLATSNLFFVFYILYWQLL